MMIKDMPRHVMPREKLMEKGAENLKDHELMAVLLCTGIAGKNVLNVSRDILQKFPTKKLLHLNYKDLSQIKGIGPAKACLLLAAFELTKRALDVQDNNLPTIVRAKEAVAQLQELRTVKKEHFVALYLNARNQLVHKETISVGTLNASLIHPREVFKPALEHLATSIIVAHNHPSGDVTPSDDDISVTKRLTEAGRVMGVELIDHIIITQTAFYSFQEKGDV
ncbi:MAG: DNA repair protein RadC [Parcubacteria group bacterium]|jgi:DNA repair protein RadC